MLRRLIIALLLIVPMAAHADTATDSALQPGGTGAASSQTSSILQPANTSNASTLQSASASGSGVAQPQQNQSETLQNLASSDQAKLFIQGDVDSAPASQPTHSLTWLLYVAIVLVATTLVIAVLWLWQRRLLKQITK